MLIVYMLGELLRTIYSIKNFIQHARTERHDHGLYRELESTAVKWRKMKSLEDDKLWYEILWIPRTIPLFGRYIYKPSPRAMQTLEQLSSESISEYLSSKLTFKSLSGAGERTRLSPKLFCQLDKLPKQVRRQIIEKDDQFIKNFNHPDLKFQEVYRNSSIYSMPIGKGYRAFCKKYENDDIFIWFWFGSHLKYKELDK